MPYSFDGVAITAMADGSIAAEEECGCCATGVGPVCSIENEVLSGSNLSDFNGGSLPVYWTNPSNPQFADALDLVNDRAEFNYGYPGAKNVRSMQADFNLLTAGGVNVSLDLACFSRYAGIHAIRQVRFGILANSYSSVVLCGGAISLDTVTNRKAKISCFVNRRNQATNPLDLFETEILNMPDPLVVPYVVNVSPTGLVSVTATGYGTASATYSNGGPLGVPQGGGFGARCHWAVFASDSNTDPFQQSPNGPPPLGYVDNVNITVS